MSSTQIMSSPLDQAADNLEAQDSKGTGRPPNTPTSWCLVLLYSIVTVTGIVCYPLAQRLYFIHGGSSKWLSSLLSSVGCILFIFPLSFIFLKGISERTPAIFMDPRLTLSSASLGLLVGLDTFLYSTGYSSLPVSTSSLLTSTTLAFTALFAFIIVRQKITFYSINSVVVVTCGVVVLALHTSGDQPAGESRKKYLLGFFSTLVASVLQGLLYPLVEFVYGKSTKPMSFLMILQFQFVNGLFSSLFITAGMLISKDYKVIAKEAAEFSLGETKYWGVLIAIVVLTQFSSFGALGLISCTSSLFAGILSAVALPMNEVASIITFGDKFNGQKGLSLSLCLWGFTSYFVGEYKKTGKTKLIDDLNSVNDVNPRNVTTELNNEVHVKDKTNDMVELKLLFNDNVNDSVSKGIV